MRLAPVKRHWTLVSSPGRANRETDCLAEAVTESFWEYPAGQAELIGYPASFARKVRCLRETEYRVPRLSPPPRRAAHERERPAVCVRPPFVEPGAGPGPGAPALQMHRLSQGPQRIGRARPPPSDPGG